VPADVDELLATFREENRGLRHRVYSEREAESLIAERFGAREVAAFRACAVPSMQSDYFRYCIVLERGGVYADVDYRCLRPLRPLIAGQAGGEIFLSPTPLELRGRDATRIWSGFLAFREPGHPFLRLALEIATANIEARIPDRIWAPGENLAEAIGLSVGPGVPTLMRLIRDWGSFDAFVQGVAGTPAEPFAELYCEVIGSHERIVEAFDGVRVSPHTRMLEWVADPERPLSYKRSDLHWKNTKTAIFRCSSPRQLPGSPPSAERPSSRS